VPRSTLAPPSTPHDPIDATILPEQLWNGAYDDLKTNDLLVLSREPSKPIGRRRPLNYNLIEILTLSLQIAPGQDCPGAHAHPQVHFQA
jgi:hypothetical protein